MAKGKQIGRYGTGVGEWSRGEGIEEVARGKWTGMDRERGKV